VEQGEDGRLSCRQSRRWNAVTANATAPFYAPLWLPPALGATLVREQPTGRRAA
jgi:hypothetical protein